MATRGSKSNSFLRESSLTISIVPTQRWDQLKDFLKKDKNGRSVYDRAAIKNFFDVKNIKKHIVLNASNLKYWKLQEVMDFLENDFKEFMEDLGVAGCIEYHKADETQNSDHLHFWITDDSNYIRSMITSFIVDNDICKRNDVNIQKYDALQKIPQEELHEVDEENLHVNSKFIKQKTASRFITKKTTTALSSIKEDVFLALDDLLDNLEDKKVPIEVEKTKAQVSINLLQEQLDKLDIENNAIIEDVKIEMETLNARNTNRSNI
jgi:hypothetical protein